MLKHCIIVIFLGLVPGVQLTPHSVFKTNASIPVYDLVDELNDLIKILDKHNTNWDSSNHFIGPLHRFAIHDKYCGDFSTLIILKEPHINAVYHKRFNTMMYSCVLVFGLEDLYFGFKLDINFFGQKWESSHVKITAKENAWEVTFDVHIRTDGYCKVKFLDSKILYLGGYEVHIKPKNHYMRKWFVWVLARPFAWSYFQSWNQMLKGAVKEEISSSPLANMICQRFADRER